MGRIMYDSFRQATTCLYEYSSCVPTYQTFLRFYCLFQIRTKLIRYQGDYFRAIPMRFLIIFFFSKR